MVRHGHGHARQHGRVPIHDVGHEAADADAGRGRGRWPQGWSSTPARSVSRPRLTKWSHAQTVENPAASSRCADSSHQLDGTPMVVRLMPIGMARPASPDAAMGHRERRCRPRARPRSSVSVARSRSSRRQVRALGGLLLGQACRTTVRMQAARTSLPAALLATASRNSAAASISNPRTPRPRHLLT